MGFIEIIDREERLSRRFGDSIIYFRRIDWEKAEEMGGEADEARRRMEIIDYVIVAWENVRHPITKEEVPCTRENKLKLPQRVLVEILNEARGSMGGEELKNSEST